MSGQVGYTITPEGEQMAGWRRATAAPVSEDQQQLPPDQGEQEQVDPMVAKLLAAKERAADPQHRIDVSDMTSDQFIAMLRNGGRAAK